MTKDNNNLTKREEEILTHMKCGMSNKEISEALNISIITVQNYVSRILHKYCVHDRKKLIVENKDTV